MISGSRVNGGIISSTLNESVDFIIQEFKVEVEKAGNYYLFAWIRNGALIRIVINLNTVSQRLVDIVLKN